MKPVPQSLLRPLIGPLLVTQIVESKVPDRTDPETILKALERGYQNRSLSVFVDDLENPTAGMVLGTKDALWFEGVTCYVHRIWAQIEDRGRMDVVDDMFRTIVAFAELHGCNSIEGASWVFRGAPDTGALWLRKGFEVQETVYVKFNN